MIIRNCHMSMGIKYLNANFVALLHWIKFTILVNKPMRIHWRQNLILAWLPNLSCAPSHQMDPGEIGLKLHWLKVMVTSASPLPVATLKSSSRNINKVMLTPQ